MLLPAVDPPVADTLVLHTCMVILTDDGLLRTRTNSALRSPSLTL